MAMLTLVFVALVFDSLWWICFLEFNNGFCLFRRLKPLYSQGQNETHSLGLVFQSLGTPAALAPSTSFLKSQVAEAMASTRVAGLLPQYVAPSEEGILWGTEQRKSLFEAMKEANYRWDAEAGLWQPKDIVEPAELAALGNDGNAVPISTRLPTLPFAAHFEWNAGFLWHLLMPGFGGVEEHTPDEKRFLTYCWLRCRAHGINPHAMDPDKTGYLNRILSVEVPYDEVLELTACFPEDFTSCPRADYVCSHREICLEWFSHFQKGPGKSTGFGTPTGSGNLFFRSSENLNRHHHLLNKYYQVVVDPATTVTIKLPRATAVDMRNRRQLSKAWQEGWWWECEKIEGSDGSYYGIRFPMEVTVWTYSREEVTRFVLREEAGGLSPELRILES